MNVTVSVIIIGILFYILTCLALFDIIKKDFGKLYKKILWGGITLIPFIGCIIYFILGSRKGKKLTVTNL